MTAFLNAADGSIATIWIWSRHACDRWPSQASTAALSRPSTTPRTCPEATLTRGRHPRLDPPPAAHLGVSVPTHPAVAVLVDTQMLHVQTVDVGQPDRGSVHAPLSGPPRHPIVLGDLSDRLSLIDDRGQQRRPQPNRAPGPPWQLTPGLGERLRGHARSAHTKPRLHHDQLQAARARHVLDPLPTPRMDTRRDHPALRPEFHKGWRLVGKSALSGVVWGWVSGH